MESNKSYRREKDHKVCRINHRNKGKKNSLFLLLIAVCVCWSELSSSEKFIIYITEFLVLQMTQWPVLFDTVQKLCGFFAF